MYIYYVYVCIATLLQLHCSYIVVNYVLVYAMHGYIVATLASYSVYTVIYDTHSEVCLS